MKKLIFILLLLPVFALPAVAFSEGGLVGQEKININTATLEQLDLLTGIGLSYAQRIIDNRPFSSIDDLLEIKGIGEKTLQKIKDQGLAYVNVEEKTTKADPIKIKEAPELIQETNSAQTGLMQNYPSGIKLSEVLPSPEGPDAENEWIEIYNNSDSNIDLTGWIIKDTTGSIKEYILSSEIPALSYLVIKRPDSGITLNNDGDGLILLNPNKEVIDSINFGKAVQEQSYIRTTNEWTWTTTPTPGSKNILKTPTLTQKPKTPSISTEKEPQGSAESGTLQNKLVEELERSPKISVVFVGFLLALCCSIAFLIIKNNLKNFWY